MNNLDWSGVVEIKPSDDTQNLDANSRASQRYTTNGSVSMKKKLYIATLITLLFIILSIPYTQDVMIYFITRLTSRYISLNIIIVLVIIFFSFTYLILWLKL